ncbi:hypothetical protein DM02DRAFT_633558 [Periconia macrospinosa]|uniref:Transmembrane protein n=1 Tax=Periconia macrospinosa TaxID=97972 RepID=A0A2V1DBU6_9PLEO|nr:hypothetical protein DM02DRAFT_633558 [Periconia macrospinosa]
MPPHLLALSPLSSRGNTVPSKNSLRITTYAIILAIVLLIASMGLLCVLSRRRGCRKKRKAEVVREVDLRVKERLKRERERIEGFWKYTGREGERNQLLLPAYHSNTDTGDSSRES